MIAELSAFLRRMPALLDCSFADASPFADAQTRRWIEAEVLIENGAANKAAQSGDQDDAAGEARKLVAEGKLSEAIALLHQRAASARTAEARFRVRLELATLLMETDQPAVARAVFSSLDEEIRTRGLEEWNPGLAAACVQGHLQCLKTLARTGKDVSDATLVMYNRLCRLDPAAAIRFGS